MARCQLWLYFSIALFVDPSEMISSKYMRRVQLGLDVRRRKREAFECVRFHNLLLTTVESVTYSLEFREPADQVTHTCWRFFFYVRVLVFARNNRGVKHSNNLFRLLPRANLGVSRRPADCVTIQFTGEKLTMEVVEMQTKKKSATLIRIYLSSTIPDVDSTVHSMRRRRPVRCIVLCCRM
jgi:hypothetical protein